MKKLALTCVLLIIAMTLLNLSGNIFTIGFASSKSAQVSLANNESTASSEPTLQEWFNQNGYAINVTTDETGIETFEAGYYKVAILTEIAGYALMNNLSWYLTSNGQLNYIFLGENTTGDTAYFLTDEIFGLCLGSPEGYFYTESCRNEDGKDHAFVFMNPNATGYIIAWEDLWQLGDADFQDFVLAALTPIKVKVCYCPRTLNLKSKGRWITALIKLPNDYQAKDVDISSIMLNGTVPADQKHYTIFDCKDLHLLVVKFNRTAVIELVRNSLKEAGCKKKSTKVSLTVTGKFLDGLPFQGANKIRVIHFECSSCHCHNAKGLQCKLSYRLTGIHATWLQLLRGYLANRRS
jgi:hypothetical protein